MKYYVTVYGKDRVKITIRYGECGNEHLIAVVEPHYDAIVVEGLIRAYASIDNEVIVDYKD